MFEPAAKTAAVGGDYGRRRRPAVATQWCGRANILAAPHGHAGDSSARRRAARNCRLSARLAAAAERPSGLTLKLAPLNRFALVVSLFAVAQTDR